MKSAPIKKRIIALIIIIMFIGIGNLPSMGINVVEKTTILTHPGNILYVGGTGEDNYTKIQDAIDNASDGDTVFVYDDSSPYYEYLLINKTINLIGESKYTTIIDAQYKDTPVEISNADNSFISGFTIQNCPRSGTEYQHAVVDIVRSDYVIIKDNILTIGYISANDWTCAVELDNCMYCKIQDNIIFEDIDIPIGRLVGVSLHDGSSHNTVSGNDISNYTFGVRTTRVYTNLNNDYNIISGNHIHDNGDGIDIYGDTYNEILNNKIEHNACMGIYCTEAHNTIISGNIIKYNNYGIFLTWYSTNNYISDNVISNNYHGIYMLTGVDNVVTRNNFIDNGKNGTSEREYGNVYFVYELSQWKFFRLNCWRRNYWSDHSWILPKAIHGVIEILGLRIPRIEFDRFPALRPYDIDA
jgi:parallel beta-helix repeat protein